MNDIVKDKIILTRAGMLSSGFKPLIPLQQITQLAIKSCVAVATLEYERGLLDNLFSISND